MRTNHVVILFLAIVMGGIAALWSRYWLVSRSHMSADAAPIGSIVVAAKPLAFGAVVTADNVSEIPWAAAALPELIAEPIPAKLPAAAASDSGCVVTKDINFLPLYNDAVRNLLVPW